MLCVGVGGRGGVRWREVVCMYVCRGGGVEGARLCVRRGYVLRMCNGCCVCM